MNKPLLYAALALTSALLAACGDTSVTTPPAQPVVAPTAVSGTLSSWTGGAGTMELLADDTASKSASNPVLSTGALAADGSFSVALPAAAAVQPYLVPAKSVFVNSSAATCSGTFSSSDAGAQAFASYRLDVRVNGTYVTSAEPVSFSDQSSGTNLQGTTVYRFWVYADRATTLGGQQDCTNSQPGLNVTSHATMNAALSAGWNLMRETSVISGVKGSGQGTLSVALTSSSDASGPWETASLNKLSANPLRMNLYTAR
ncbi:hypothetical protein MF271_16660 [Deinococcus sp. KNUC1210]|uniref:hypothetical protein n=1 Tax=Deinococcus sp. KNUC1210 TaxID=2917691 RepID=UPI001EF14EDD|nr:hypothetical protein [Deinococcus sp. KNUC1210]ULH15520.1 hypothetical protein MF271_16660 [Deinococcus sp. KNUC1210]